MGYLVGNVSTWLTYTINIEKIHSPNTIDAELIVEPTSGLEFPTEIALTSTEFVAFEKMIWELTGTGETSIPMELTESNDHPTGEISLWHEETEYSLFSPSAPVLYAIKAALSGEPENAVEMVMECYGEPSGRFGKLGAFRNDCRRIVAFDRYVDLVGALSDFSPRFEMIEHRNRYDHFAKTLNSVKPHSVESLEELEKWVELYNESPRLSNITIPEVLMLYLADNLNPKARARIQNLGIDPTEYDGEYETPIPAGWIGHIYLTDGFRNSEYFARDRPKLPGPYERNKGLAKTADYGERGSTWARLIADAARQPLEEYRFVGSNMLHWTGEESRSDAPFPPMFHRAAKEMVDEMKNPRLHQLAAVGEQLSLGHVNRRDHEWESSQAAFERARELAREDGGFGYTRRVREGLNAIGGMAIASDQLHRQRGEFDEAVASLGYAITEIGGMEAAAEETREEILSLLRAKRFEAQGDQARTEGNTDTAKDPYRNAIEEYEKVGKTRSRDRVESNLNRL